MDIPVRHLPHDGQECPSYIVRGCLLQPVLAGADRPIGKCHGCAPVDSVPQARSARLPESETT